MIVLVHLMFLIAVYLGLPALSAVLEDGGVILPGGIYAAVGLAVASEVVLVIVAVLANLVTQLVGINPLLQRKKAEAIAQTAIYCGLAVLLALLPSSILVLAWYWVLIVPAFICLGMQVIVTVKRRMIARSYR
jgi:hypothetical protein